MNETLPFRLCTDGIELAVRLTPRSTRDAVDGVKLGPDGAYVQARVRAVPENGRANTALIELVAGELDVAKSLITLVSGQTSRLKRLHVTGNVTELASRATTWLKRTQ